MVYVDVGKLNAIQWYVGRGFGFVPFQPAAKALDVDEMADIPSAPDGALPVHDVMLDRGESQHDGRKGTPLAYCLRTGRGLSQHVEASLRGGVYNHATATYSLLEEERASS